MTDPFARLRRFLRELQRRKVYRAAAGYLVVAFVVLQLANLAADAFGFPSWFEPMVWVVAGLGFPIVLVLAWAFEMTPEGVRRTPITGEAGDASTSEEMSLEERRAQSRLAMKALVGLGLVGAAVAGGWYLTGGGGESPKIGERTVAVLPFQVSGSGADTWRDGMVTMLSTGLDGAAGLRAIADRTILAAWEADERAGQGAATEEALSVAREVGARFAVVGSAVQLGNELRLTVDLHDTHTGERMAQVAVEGSPDSVTSLTDSLTRRVLGALLEKGGGELPSVDLASLTTRSLPALKSYLTGERHYRAGEYGEAVGAFESAVTTDSTFALAWARLQSARFWSGGQRAEVYEAARKAYRMSDRLPERARRIVRAKFLWVPQGRHQAARDSLRRLTEAYPDDPSVWHWLGEVLYHGSVPRGKPEADKAYERATELEPGLPPLHHHYVELAFVLHHDSARAAARISAHPPGDHREMYRLAHDLVFGAPGEREKALERLDTIPLPTVFQLTNTLRHPTDRDLEARALRRILEREDIDPDRYSRRLAANSLERGQVRKALDELGAGHLPSGVPSASCLVAWSIRLGGPVPDSVARQLADPGELGEDASSNQLMCSGIYLVERDRAEETQALIRRMRGVGAEEGLSEEKIQARVDELKGYRAWRGGRLQRAAELWNDTDESEIWGAIWRGDLYRDLANPEEAEGWYLAAWRHPIAHERLGRLYEETGESERAVAAYRRFITAWEDADPELQDRVEEARKRLQALTGSGADSGD